jgi:DNA polymerase-1
MPATTPDVSDDPTLPRAFDSETYLIAPGNPAPPIVCGSWATEHGAGILSADDVRAKLPGWIDKSEMLVGANIAFDFIVAANDEILARQGILDRIFAAYEEGRVYDVLIAQALGAIAEGNLFRDPRTGGPLKSPSTGKQMARYSLEVCVDLTLGRIDAKVNDFYRLRYAILAPIPMADWPEEARVYPVDDARNTFEVAMAQAGGSTSPSGVVTKEPLRNLHGMRDQARAAFALALASAQGLRTDPARVATLEAKVNAAHAAVVQRFTGLYLRDDGTEDQAAVKRAVATAYGATGKCRRCGGTGKVKSAVSGNPVVCKAADVTELGDDKVAGCDGTGLDLTTAPTRPRTEKGGIKADRDTLMESGDEDLSDYGADELDKIRTTYIPTLKEAAKWPVNPRANVLLETLRTSYDGIWQTFTRAGGVRECFVPIQDPDDPWCIVSIDYAAVELCTFAQCCIDMVGFSRMAEVINASGDPGSLHTAFAARMRGVDPDAMKALVKAKDKDAVGFRQAAKAANFGFPGGMGAPMLVLAKRKKSEGTTVTADGTTYSGIRFCVYMAGALRCGVEKVTEWKGRTLPPTCKACIQCAEDLRKLWFQEWPEAKPYFDVVSHQVDNTGEVTFIKSDIVRGAVSFTSGSNGYFQSRAASGAKHALWKITQECYTDRASPMFGARPYMFAHDETLSYHRIRTLHESAFRMAEVQRKAMEEWVPDVTISCEPAAMHYWSKDAATVYDENGRLKVWVPDEKAGP